jgi:hypothetical protein
LRNTDLEQTQFAQTQKNALSFDFSHALLKGTAFNFLSIGLLLYGVYYIGAMGKIRIEDVPVDITDHAHLNQTMLELKEYDLVNKNKYFIKILS